MLKLRTIFNIGALLIIIVIVVNCNSTSDKSSRKIPSGINVSEGKKLAEQYCSTCHPFPKAEILPTHYWGRVLPIMGFFLGAGKQKFKFADYSNPVAKMRLTASGLFPDSQLIATKDWIAINNYYLYMSPKKLIETDNLNIEMDLGQFTVEQIPWKSGHEGLTYLNFVNGNYELGYNTSNDSYYLKLDSNGNEIEKTKTDHPLVDVIKRDNSEYLLLMGQMNNIDEPTGKLLLKNNGLKELLDPLERPISFEIEDFNNDGEENILIAEFGKFLGGINIYNLRDPESKLNIYSSPGAVKTIVKDVNNDGLKDFYVLMAQADESVYLFMNQGDFKFNIKSLITMPSYYGTTNFELLDMDGDGDDDIICSSGDSGDFGIVFKPFHGVRLFENQGNNQYEQVWFHPQQGAYGTASADYDNDGDIDIASIGYFASYLNRNKELFIYFENKGNEIVNWKFKPHSFRGDKNDCWIVINNADVDNDGDIDILLGANSKVLNPERKAEKLNEWQQDGGMVTVLRNNLIN